MAKEPLRSPPTCRMQLSDLAGRATISVDEVADLLGLGRTAVYDALKRGELPSFKVGRRVLIPVPRLIALLYGDANEGSRRCSIEQER